ncbi:VanW family protein [Brevibacillus ginsengisoli]|uniref:VanW family protein n=1 Tax=Brevibacillus ginsengisoli TaxID=363854 RepID=UPI003CF23D93
MRPIRRGRIRTALGITYYRMKRYFTWLVDSKKYARKLVSQPLPHLIFSHQSVLRRPLRNVEMWMQENKIINLQIAVKQLNGVVIRPGETFSYWRCIGKPTRRKGYVEGMILSHGQVVSGVGGGLCQLSNLIYWMTLHTPLTVTERYRHSYDVFPDTNRQQPFGSGATCFYNYLDLQVKNQTSDEYQLHLYLTDTHLVGEWRSVKPALYSYEVYEHDHSITAQYGGGYVRKNRLYRRVFSREMERLKEEFLTENHAMMMYEPLLGAGSDG